MIDKPERHEHPSYGMIGMYRQSHSGGGARLFGSSLDTHYSSVRIVIRHAVWEHDLNRDTYFGRDAIAEVTVSAAQFAEMITNMNVGSGVPCTIGFIEGKGSIARPPDEPTEVQRIKANFEKTLKQYGTKMATYRKEVDELTMKLPAKTRERLRICLDVITDQLTRNVPFITEMFNEATEGIVTAAKHEIENFAQHALRSVGLEALAEGRLPKMLAASVDRRAIDVSSDEDR